MLFTAGGIATPADAAMMMQLGAEGVFVGSGIFKSGNPAQRAEAIVKATTFYDDPDVVAKVSRGLGEAMVGINVEEHPAAAPARRARLVKLRRQRIALAAVALALLPLSACDGEPSADRRLPVGRPVGGRPRGDDHWRPARRVPDAGVRRWRGIPFAAPPVGDLRWRPPADPEPWSGVRDARAYGETCLQGPSSGLGLIDLEGGSEDCLTLNVTRPDDRPRGPAGHGVDPRRLVPARLRQPADLQLRGAGRPAASSW